MALQAVTARARSDKRAFYVRFTRVRCVLRDKLRDKPRPRATRTAGTPPAVRRGDQGAPAGAGPVGKARVRGGPDFHPAPRMRGLDNLQVDRLA